MSSTELQRQADISCKPLDPTSLDTAPIHLVDFLSPITYWPLIEASLQIVAACLTMLRPFVEDWRLIFWNNSSYRVDGYLNSNTLGSASGHHVSAAEDGVIYKTSDVRVEFRWKDVEGRTKGNTTAEEVEYELEMDLRRIR